MAEEQLDFYRDVEAEYWGSAWGSKPDEVAILDCYLSPERSTVEAGTGNGRILFLLRERGFRKLAGFDFVPELIDRAREAEGENVAWTVADARSLPYPDSSFEQAIYLSQVACLFESEADRTAVVREAVRILRPGGTALFSFLPYEVRRADPRYRPLLRYLAARRRLTSSSRPEQLLPRIRVGGRLWLGPLRDEGPHMYWFRTREAEHLLRSAGFEIEAVGSTPQVLAGRMAGSAAELEGLDQSGTLYFVARRPAR